MTSKSLPYRLLWALWALIAIPAFAMSIWLLGEPPLWPHFGDISTSEGVLIWAVVAAAFYGLPLFLFAIRKVGRESQND